MKLRHLHHGVVRVVCLFAAAVVFATALPVAGVKAEAGQAFSISPPLIELKADPGQTVNATIKFTNVSGGELLIKTQFNDFGAKDESGDPNIIFDDTQSVTYSLRNWIASPQPFKIASKETKTLTFPITVPNDAEPGGHYAVIRFTGTAPDLEQSGVSLTGSIGSLVLLQVAGDIKEDAEMIEFAPATVHTKQNGDPEYTNTSFFETGPLGFVQRIKNSGNVHVKPTGTVEIFNAFGSKVSTVRVNGDPTNPKDPPKSVLPQSTRRFGETVSDAGFLFGYYTAKVNVSYGQGQKQLTQTINFWVIPYKLIILVVVIGTALFFLLRVGIRRYNQHIIGRAGGSKTFSSADGKSKLSRKKK
ncbi:MAG TPA: hypothetical protein VJM32_06125 [Candidatus Saccharimonadales bacterium]|nr:hypothetical protein [Candidatus Saccharimonadales bacterium]